MTFERFKEIFNELGIDDQATIKEKWQLANLFQGTDNLDEDILKWSIKTYILGQ